MTPQLVTRPLLLGAATLGMLLASCGSNEAAATIRISTIPDKDKTKIAAKTTKLRDYLEEQTGLPIRFEPSNDYTAAVNGLLANKLDLVWLGGVTSIDADKGAEGEAMFVATRDIDLEFKTYFIANQKALESGKVKNIDNLEDLKAMAKDLTLTFGSKKSTSGHIMPRHFLVEAGIAPETDFQSAPLYSGNHSATLTDVANGSVDIGAINFSTYDSADADLKAKAPIFYTTPDYVDYCWIGHKRVGEDKLNKIKDALLALDKNNPDHAVILEAWGAGKFVAADPKQWDGIRGVLDSLPKDFLK
ncbi:MAG: phosphate/phosphite/phosphonate ABC transporter substrate-binding protein [Planctomycetota bacterium]|nr:phosphate/phosphite/phosphonate ABC transporter substrate-binding protein [Planctomycetota bacterium]